MGSSVYVRLTERAAWNPMSLVFLGVIIVVQFNLSHVSNGGLYADQNQLLWSPLWWQRKGLQETASGYGSRLNSGYMISFEGRLRRVYTTIWSNSGTSWFRYKNNKITVR